MRLLPSGTTALLVELDDLEQVLGLYAALVDNLPAGVVDVLPAARTVLVVTDPSATSLSAVAEAVRRTTPRHDRRHDGEQVEIPVTYDGEDLEEAATLLGCDVAEQRGRLLEVFAVIGHRDLHLLAVVAPVVAGRRTPYRLRNSGE